MRLPVLNESAYLRYFTFYYLYIMQGIPAGFALTAIANFLLGNHVTSQVVGTFIGVVGLPWTIQFIWGPFIDRFQYSVIGHRKHWVVISQFVAVLVSCSLMIVHDPLRQLTLLGAVFFIHSVFASVQDASVDALAISIVPAGERGRINGFMRGGFLSGMAFGAAGLAYVLHEYGFRTAAMLQTIVLLFFTLLTFVIKVDRHDAIFPTFNKSVTKKIEEENPDVKDLFRRIYAAMTKKQNLRYFLIISTVYFCFSVFIRSFTFHLINVLEWPDRSVSIMQGTWGSVLTFIGILAGGYISDKVGAQKMQIAVLWFLGLFLIILNIFYFLWHYETFSSAGLIIWNLADPLFSVAAFPILMAICADKVEGSQFTAYMALINFCDVLGSYITGWTLNFVAAPYLGLGCGIVILLMIAALKRQKYPHYGIAGNLQAA